MGEHKGGTFRIKRSREQVREMLMLYYSGKSTYYVAVKYNCYPAYVRDLKNGMVRAKDTEDLRKKYGNKPR